MQIVEMMCSNRSFQRINLVFDLDRRVQSLHEKIERKRSTAIVLLISSFRQSLQMTDFHFFAECSRAKCIQNLGSSLSRFQTYSCRISVSYYRGFAARRDQSQTFDRYDLLNVLFDQENECSIACSIQMNNSVFFITTKFFLFSFIVFIISMLSSSSSSCFMIESRFIEFNFMSLREDDFDSALYAILIYLRMKFRFCHIEKR